MKLQFMKTAASGFVSILVLTFFVMSCGCGSATATKQESPLSDSITNNKPVTANSEPIDIGKIAPDEATNILSRKQVPILCYHHIRDWKPTDSKRAKDYIVPTGNFRDQLKMLADSGYHSILPDQLYNY